MSTNPTAGLTSSPLLNAILGGSAAASVAPDLNQSLGLALSSATGNNDLASFSLFGNAAASPFSLGAAATPPATSSLPSLISSLLGQNSIYSILGPIGQNALPFVGSGLGTVLGGGTTGNILGSLLGPGNLSSSLAGIIGGIFNVGSSPITDRLLPGIFSGGGGGLFGSGGLLGAIAGSAVQTQGGKPLVLSSLLGSSVGRADLFGGTSSVISNLFKSFATPAAAAAAPAAAPAPAPADAAPQADREPQPQARTSKA